MVIDLAAKAGLSADRLYFNVETMGNTSSASIPIAIADAVAEKVIDRPMWIFAPGFGAGSVAGYAVMRIDPAIVAPSAVGGEDAHSAPAADASERAGPTPCERRALSAAQPPPTRRSANVRRVSVRAPLGTLPSPPSRS